MAQTKKPEVREAILQAAFDLFSRKGYTATTMTEIARTANMTVANLYVYFESKLLIFYEIYRPWMIEQLEALRQSVKKLRSPRTRLRRVFIGVWADIPAKDHSFANCMIEALAVAPPGTQKPGRLLDLAESYIDDLIIECLPEEHPVRSNPRLLSHIIWMAFDGFVINRHIGDTRDIDALADLMTGLLLGPDEI